jgi:ABC-type branched-subunit amino acid transport system substrate-binding protein
MLDQKQGGKAVSGSRHRRIGASVAGLALTLAACGSSKNSTGANATTTAGPTTTAGATTTTGQAATTTSAAGAPTAPPASMAEWEALWTKQRDAIVKRIKDNKWGLSADGKTITGPEGFTIDVTKCASGWSNTEGITDTEIKIGQAMAQSGTLASYGQIGKGIQNRFDIVNKAGGIKDSTGKSRQLKYIVKDDGYDAARTIPLVDELIDSEKVFAVWTLGSPNTLATYDKLNQRCIPQPLSMTGHPAWGDPVNHPWTTGMALAYNAEAGLWGKFIEDRASELKGSDGKITVAGLVMNNEFGAAYDGGFRDWLASTPLKDSVNYVTEKIEPTAPTVTDAMTTLAAKKPAMFIAETAGVSCTQTILEAAQNGLKGSAKYLMFPQTCKTGFASKDKVGGDGSVSDGWWVVGGGLKPIGDPSMDTDPYAVEVRKELADGGIDYKKEPLALLGYEYEWAMEQTLLIASQLDGGLTRANFIVALRSMDMTHPYLFDGAKFNMNGDKDAYLIEASEYSKFDAAKQSWIKQGDLVDNSGKTANCAWDKQKGACG